MNYWLDLFTGTTWREFLQAGANVSGFREKQRNITKRVQSGDILVCYFTGVMRWVGALEVIKPTNDHRQIWSDNFQFASLREKAARQGLRLYCFLHAHGETRRHSKTRPG